MADTVVATDQPVPQTGRPAEDLAAAFENFRTSLLAHPALVPVVARRPPGDEATRQTPTGCVTHSVASSHAAAFIAF